MICVWRTERMELPWKIRNLMDELWSNIIGDYKIENYENSKNVRNLLVDSFILFRKHERFLWKLKKDLTFSVDIQVIDVQTIKEHFWELNLNETIAQMCDNNILVELHLFV